jgi:hypothetical protein
LKYVGFLRVFIVNLMLKKLSIVENYPMLPINTRVLEFPLLNNANVTAKFKINIHTDTYYVDKNILRNKIGTVGNTNVISIAIHHIDFKKRKKIMDCHQSLYAALKEL